MSKIEIPAREVLLKEGAYLPDTMKGRDITAPDGSRVMFTCPALDHLSPEVQAQMQGIARTGMARFEGTLSGQIYGAAETRQALALHSDAWEQFFVDAHELNKRPVELSIGTPIVYWGKSMSLCVICGALDETGRLGPDELNKSTLLMYPVKPIVQNGEIVGVEDPFSPEALATGEYTYNEYVFPDKGPMVSTPKTISLSEGNITNVFLALPQSAKHLRRDHSHVDPEYCMPLRAAN